ncbi:hypothetical protein KIN20_029715 [Parelaphostrongylus tenuis]|uniref:Uncharacterized protein n=1 Tax=Parelaphostrongylus tenuis TaxID=148309 RepID=A0AAD5R323_PARTN|nr:hypothetical protein KIN20_029715 [Parelaphostrongylus tenuis]
MNKNQTAPEIAKHTGEISSKRSLISSLELSPLHVLTLQGANSLVVFVQVVAHSLMHMHRLQLCSRNNPMRQIYTQHGRFIQYLTDATGKIRPHRSMAKDYKQCEWLDCCPTEYKQAYNSYLLLSVLCQI